MVPIELIEDLRYDYKRLDAAAMVAGNVWNAGVVLGTPVTDWRALDLARVTANAGDRVLVEISGLGTAELAVT